MHLHDRDIIFTYIGKLHVAKLDDAMKEISSHVTMQENAGCPIVWVSKLQTEVALSTTEAEYIALTQAMRDLIPLLGLLEELRPVLSLNNDQPDVHWKS